MKAVVRAILPASIHPLWYAGRRTFTGLVTFNVLIINAEKNGGHVTRWQEKWGTRNPFVLSFLKLRCIYSLIA